LAEVAMLPEQPETEALPAMEIPVEAEIPMEEQDASWIWTPAWIKPVEWDGSVEVGMNGMEGNSNTLSLRTGADFKRKTDLSEILVKLTYVKTTAEGVETQHAAFFDAGYERFLGESPWTYYLKNNLVYNEFKPFDLRVVFNGGLGYQLIRTDAQNLKTRLGAGVSHEVNGPDDAWKPEAMFGLDYECELTDRQKLTARCDYFPQWDDFNDFRLNTDISWQVQLDAAHNLSLKLSVIDVYDSTPNGAKPNDINYALLLLWKM
jgi:putative salt-induced outer membrane protein YdiY